MEESIDFDFFDSPEEPEASISRSNAKLKANLNDNDGHHAVKRKDQSHSESYGSDLPTKSSQKKPARNSLLTGGGKENVDSNHLGQNSKNRRAEQESWDFETAISIPSTSHSQHSHSESSCSRSDSSNSSQSSDDNSDNYATSKKGNSRPHQLQNSGKRGSTSERKSNKKPPLPIKAFASGKPTSHEHHSKHVNKKHITVSVEEPSVVSSGKQKVRRRHNKYSDEGLSASDATTSDEEETTRIKIKSRKARDSQYKVESVASPRGRRSERSRSNSSEWSTG